MPLRRGALEIADRLESLVLTLAGASPSGDTAGVTHVAVVAATAGRTREHAGIDQLDHVGDEVTQARSGGRLVLRQRQVFEASAAHDRPVEAGDGGVVVVAGLADGELVDGELHAQPFLDAVLLGGAGARLVVDDAGSGRRSVDAVEATGEADPPLTPQLENHGPAVRLPEAPLHGHRATVWLGEDRVAPHRLEQVLAQHLAPDLPRQRRTRDAAPFGLGAAGLPSGCDRIQGAVERQRFGDHALVGLMQNLVRQHA